MGCGGGDAPRAPAPSPPGEADAHAEGARCARAPGCALPAHGGQGASGSRQEKWIIPPQRTPVSPFQREQLAPWGEKACFNSVVSTVPFFFG